MNKENTRVLEWDEVDKACFTIAKYARFHHIKSVMGIARGGLIPAVLVARRLGVPVVQQPNSDTLIVDDISDSGQTLDQYHKKYAVATVCYKSSSKVKPNVYCFVIPEDVWVVFPWEMMDQ